MAQSYSGFIVFYAWLSNSFPRPAAKRAVVLALTNALSQLGNIAGSYARLSLNSCRFAHNYYRYIWPKDKFGPTYRNSYAICIATSGLSIIMCFMFRQELQRQNKKLQEAEEAQLGEGETAEPGYRYML